MLASTDEINFAIRESPVSWPAIATWHPPKKYFYVLCRDSYHSNGIPEDPYEVRPDDKYFPGRVRPPVSPRGPVRSGSPPRRAASPAARHAPSPGRGSEIYSGRERPARRDLSPGGMPRSPRGGSPLPRSRELSPVRYVLHENGLRPLFADKLLFLRSCPLCLH